MSGAWFVCLRLAFKMIAEQLPKEETEGLRLVFDQIDEDGNGRITVDELKQAMERKGVDSKECEFFELVHALDIDCNGELDYTEFVAANVQVTRIDF